MLPPEQHMVAQLTNIIFSFFFPFHMHISFCRILRLYINCLLTPCSPGNRCLQLSRTRKLVRERSQPSEWCTPAAHKPTHILHKENLLFCTFSPPKLPVSAETYMKAYSYNKLGVNEPAALFSMPQAKSHVPRDFTPT